MQAHRLLVSLPLKPSGGRLGSLTCSPLKTVPGRFCPERGLKIHGATGLWMGVFSACIAENTGAIRRKNSVRAGYLTSVMHAPDTYRAAASHQFDDIVRVSV